MQNTRGTGSYKLKLQEEVEKGEKGFIFSFPTTMQQNAKKQSVPRMFDNYTFTYLRVIPRAARTSSKVAMKSFGSFITSSCEADGAG